MKLEKLVKQARNKENFKSLNDYIFFASRYLEFVKDNLQAVIVSRNENNYRFFQYKEDGTYNVTRPINSNLMYGLEEFEKESKVFLTIINNLKGKGVDSLQNRKILNSVIYSAQQSIGATLDALPANESNVARKINGDLFERFIKLLIVEIGINVKSATVSMPVKVNGETAFNMKYQHDLIIQVDSDTKAIGSVKTSSKDRLGKIFIDKFLHNKLTSCETPHFAIFLNDVQRKGKEGKFGINSTFLSGHFKGYTIKLNPLDGVYYCDIRPNMISEDILKDHIKTFDHFIFSGVWKFV